ncbi:hypothetical protein K2V58_00255 [Staphylococcus arlettae]|uniref:hypothetical protein n=1 Tax=Staphylococcus arlettae TaxID=29378 RepID=UPI001E363F9E|nr:hypothetical protein [Staphylococcus arlettae]MCD8832738.1 hypothetical protein [Staphylococcus arlettae]
MDIQEICNVINSHLKQNNKVVLFLKFGKSYNVTHCWYSEKNEHFMSLQFIDSDNIEKYVEIVTEQIAAIEYHYIK